jgi:arsenate reductase
MNRIYHLSTCDTCRKILAQLNTSGIELINLKEQHISPEDLDFMKSKTGSYESLFNKRAQKFKLIPEDQKPAKDSDYRPLILSEYTFLKRPAVILGEAVIAGNDARSVEALKQLVNGNR